MSVSTIVQEAVNENPIGLKEALQQELRDRVAVALEAMMGEEVEQIDELKKSTLSSYITKAIHDVSDAASDIGTFGTKSPQYPALRRMRKNRKQGIINAARKLAKEEVEQIDEISKETVASYAGKAFRQANTLLKHSLADQPKSVEKASKAAFKRRQFGIKAAGRRLDKDQMKAIHAAAQE